jgi:hypothetical protein
MTIQQTRNLPRIPHSGDAAEAKRCHGSEAERCGHWILKQMALAITRNNRKANQAARRKQEILRRMLVSIRSIPQATAKLNRSTITCHFSSTKDKLYAGYDSKRDRLFLTYKVEADKPDYSTLVYDIFQEASCGMDCAHSTTGSFYTQTTMSPDIAKMNLLMRRVAERLEEEDLENTLANPGISTLSLEERYSNSYFDDVARIIHYSIRDGLTWPVNGSFRKSLGFDAVDRLITVGHSDLALDSKRTEHWREHVVPAVMIRNKACDMAREHASPQEISDFLKAHLAIVIITKDEARLLDQQLTSNGKSMRTSMPEGWKWGQDPFARLKAAGIVPRFIDGFRMPQWKVWKPNLLSSLRYWANKPILRF